MAAKPLVLGPAQRLDVQDLSQRLQLHLGRGGIFLIATDHSRTKRAVERLLSKGSPGVSWHSLDASKDTDVLLQIWNLVQRRTLNPLQAVFSVHTGRLSQPAWIRFLTALNIRREYIPDGRWTLVIWMSHPRMDEFPTYAKDFWSFRTAVYRFRSTPSFRRERSPKADELETQIQDMQQLIEQTQQERGSDEPLLASLDFRLGELAYELPDMDLAMASYHQAERIYRPLQDQRNLAATLGNLGLIYHGKGDLEQAQHYHEEALHTSREIGYLLGIAGSLGNLGIVSQVKGDLEQAQHYHEEALHTSREIGYPQGVATVLGNLGAVYQAKGELEQAQHYHEEALRIDREMGDLQGVAEDLSNLGLFYQAQEELEQAQHYYEEALRIHREMGNLSNIAETLGRLGELNQAIGNTEQAQVCLKERDALNRKARKRRH